jgi:hypothetical protein
MKITNYQWTLKKLYSIKNTIDPKPQYQRGSVWALADKQLLIDSVLQGFDIPKIYLRKVGGHGFAYEVADGQQRLRAIWDYMDDKYALSPKCSVQLGDIVRSIALTHDFCTKGPFSSARFQIDDLVAHAFLIETGLGDGDMKAPDLRAMYDKYAGGIDSAVAKRVMEVLDVMHAMQVAQPRCITRKWGFVDVYSVISTLRRQKIKMDAKDLAAKYTAFERRRLENVANPGRLIEGKHTRADRNLFDYIEAFKTSAGLNSHLDKRHKVLLGVLT